MLRQLRIQKYFAEFIGTFSLIFFGTGAVVINQEFNEVISHLGVSLVFGGVVTALIFALGDVSGAHLNPAVTIAFAMSKRFSKKDVIPYIVSQFGGALMASLLLKLSFPQSEYLGATIPVNSIGQSFVFEFVLTLFLVMVIFNVSTGAKEKGLTAAIAIGSTVAVEALFGGPVSGASMNPIRSLSPALVSGHLEHVWIYLLAPVLGATGELLIHKILYYEK